jgi:hypothetical protein
MTSSPNELRTRFGAVYTAALTDVLDGLGNACPSPSVDERPVWLDVTCFRLR